MPSNTAKKSPNSRTATREVRRQQLIESTIDSISKRGFSGTTLATVTKGAKLSHGIINFYFKSKEVLYEETLGYLAQEHYDLWLSGMKNAGPEPEKQLAAILEADFNPAICSKKKLAVWFAFWGQAKYRPNYLILHHAYDDHRNAELRRVCAELIEDGGYNHIDPDSIARRIEAVVDGLWLNLLLYPNVQHRMQARNDCFTYLSEVFSKHFPHISANNNRAQK